MQCRLARAVRLPFIITVYLAKDKDLYKTSKLAFALSVSLSLYWTLAHTLPPDVRICATVGFIAAIHFPALLERPAWNTQFHALQNAYRRSAHKFRRALKYCNMALTSFLIFQFFHSAHSISSEMWLAMTHISIPLALVSLAPLIYSFLASRTIISTRRSVWRSMTHIRPTNNLSASSLIFTWPSLTCPDIFRWIFKRF